MGFVIHSEEELLARDAEQDLRHRIRVEQTPPISYHSFSSVCKPSRTCRHAWPWHHFARGPFSPVMCPGGLWHHSPRTRRQPTLSRPPRHSPRSAPHAGRRSGLPSPRPGLWPLKPNRLRPSNDPLSSTSFGGRPTWLNGGGGSNDGSPFLGRLWCAPRFKGRLSRSQADPSSSTTFPNTSHCTQTSSQGAEFP